MILSKISFLLSDLKNVLNHLTEANYFPFRSNVEVTVVTLLNSLSRSAQAISNCCNLAYTREEDAQQFIKSKIIDNFNLILAQTCLKRTF